ncbi:Ca-activated chloride channel family protein [Inquilinus ginsengisoli]|uniref:vWA domain-containing protein n=1 Tax=Inquilinus ginsengisoli TaxID=363840 RepID=UPI003D1EDF24
MAWRSLLLLASLLPFAAARAEVPRPTVIVVDASGSMSAAIGGVPRLDAARGVLGEMLAHWPAAAPVGLVAYGHRRSSDCGDIEVLSPISPPDTAALGRRLATLRARGKTPLAASLQQAAGMLQAAGGGGTIILVTDGIETCHPDPCGVAAALRAADAALSIRVIGFAVEAKDEQQLSCIASAGGGDYRTAADADSLLATLDTAARAATAPAPEPEPAPVRVEPAPAEAPPPVPVPEPVKTARVGIVAIVPGEGPISDLALDWRVAGGEGPEPFRYEGRTSLVELTVPAGRYAIDAAIGNVQAHRDVELSGEAARIEVPLAAGRLKAQAVPYQGAEPIGEGLRWTLTPLDGQAAVEMPAVAKPALLLAAGRYRLAVEHQGRRSDQEVTVAAGHPLDLAVSLRLGELKLSAALTEDGEPLTDWRGLAWRALAPDGTAAAEAMQEAAPLFTLPSGRYRVELAVAGTTVLRDVEVEEGAQREARIVVPTGSRILAAALGPGADPFTDWRDTSWTVTAVDAIGIAPGTALMQDQPVANPTVPLLPGRWHVAVKSGLATAERDLLVAPDTEETVRLDLLAGRLGVSARPEEGAPPPVNIVFEFYPVAADGSLGPAAFSGGSSESVETILPVGRWHVSAVAEDNRRAEATVDLAAGTEKLLEMTLTDGQ